jgi:hypothetical protein
MLLFMMDNHGLLLCGCEDGFILDHSIIDSYPLLLFNYINYSVFIIFLIFIIIFQ